MSPRLVAMGDSALRVELGDGIDADVNASVMALARAVASAGLSGVRDIVPTYKSVAIYFDPLRTDYDDLVVHVTRYAAERVRVAGAVSTDVLRVPVCYAQPYGLDLEVVAKWAGIRDEDVVRLHTSGTYRVYMLGFTPGFGYMGTVDDRIAIPRLETPRTRVPAGSVGIAGGQTGVYPFDTPGGWHIVGRTPLALVDFAKPEPFLLQPGGLVQFHAIGEDEFSRWPEAS